jgi:translation elongation factor EF-4
LVERAILFEPMTQPLDAETLAKLFDAVREGKELVAAIQELGLPQMQTLTRMRDHHRAAYNAAQGK